MNRVGTVKSYVDNILESITSNQERTAAFVHTYGVAECCVLIAIKRGQNPELAYICGLLHDIYSYKTGVRSFHSINGSEMVRVALKYELKDLFAEEEQTIIKSALFHHSDKEHLHDRYDEVLKDANVLQHWLCSMTNEVWMAARLINLQKEFGLPLSNVPMNTYKNQKLSGFSRASLGGVAERLAGKRIRGEKSDSDFMEIIKYFPETAAFDELKNGWCAAYVYHCVVLAGLDIPIKYSPAANNRFACVAAWLEWGRNSGFCFCNQDRIAPSRGDIVIYDNLIYSEKKPENKPWYDHIGILLSITEENITVAEGNIDNKNISGIVCRKRNEKIGCYLRIPDNYEYNGWQTAQI